MTAPLTDKQIAEFRNLITHDEWTGGHLPLQHTLRDLGKVLDAYEALLDRVECLAQVASGNDERHALLVAKHRGQPYDAARLAVLHEEVCRAFPRVDASIEAQLQIIELQAELAHTRKIAGSSLRAQQRKTSAAREERDRYREALEAIAYDSIEPYTTIAKRALAEKDVP